MVQESEVREIVREVVARYETARRSESQTTKSPPGGEPTGSDDHAGRGVFLSMDQAIAAAAASFAAFSETPLAVRRRIIEEMRKIILENLLYLSSLAESETGLGRSEDKVMKNRLAAEKTPGVEDLEPLSFTDDDGLTLVERAPYGVIGSITPSTNPTETVICNTIAMVAAGNTVVFNPHPAAKRCSRLAVSLLNEASRRAEGPENLVVTVAEPTIETGRHMMTHKDIALLCVTGGPNVVRVAMQSMKKVIAAGPGNPPAVVDETADIPKAAFDIVMGASLDNNIICTDEKEVLVVSSVADELKREMLKSPVIELSRDETDRLTRLVIKDPGSEGHEGMANKEYVGKNASVLADAIGLRVPPDTRLLICEVDAMHPLVWTEQLMPVLPIVRFPNVDEAIAFAVRCEHGFRHTASMHSRNIDKLSKMAKAMNCSLFVKNGSNFNGLGEGGAGYASYTIASPTGEGFTRPRTFTRERRCTLVGAFRIV